MTLNEIIDFSKNLQKLNSPFSIQITPHLSITYRCGCCLSLNFDENKQIIDETIQLYLPMSANEKNDLINFIYNTTYTFAYFSSSTLSYIFYSYTMPGTTYQLKIEIMIE